MTRHGRFLDRGGNGDVGLLDKRVLQRAGLLHRQLSRGDGCPQRLGLLALALELAPGENRLLASEEGLPLRSPLGLALGSAAGTRTGTVIVLR